MRALTGELLLTACEEAAEEHDLNRSLVLLSHAIPKSNRRELARLSIAERNLLLLRLRELSFGSLLQGFGACPQCGAHLEFELPVASLIERLQSHSSPGPITWSENGRHCQLRPVTTDDLLSILDMPGIREAQDRLLELCLSVSGSLAKPSACSTTDSLLEKFEQLHAAAELSCTLRCPECSVSETLDLDIARFLWIEVRSAAQRLLAEIHELAWAYGWSERSIARMSPQRRNAYLEMLSA